MQQLTSEQSRVRELFKRLRRSKLFYFPSTKDERLRTSARQGVYIIYDPRGQVVHVGASIRGRAGLRHSLNNHLNATSSFVKYHLKGHATRLRSGFSYRYLAVSSPRYRVYLENFASGFLCPVYVEFNHRKKKQKRKP